MGRLEDQVAIVTGAARGIGQATALRLAQEGAHLMINDLNEEGARETAQKVQELGCRAEISQHDVSDYQSAQELARQTHETFGRLDILVNNAGVTRDSLLLKLPEEKWDEVIRINLKGPFNMGQACAALMGEAGSGKIVNLASVAWLGNIGQTNYSASKAGVVGMTRTWALELAQSGIQVNAVAPGLIESVLTAQIPEDLRKKFIKKIPAGRIGKPEEIAGLVTFLSSSEADYITGQVLTMDGGLSVGI